MRKAFTMLELLVVVVIIGILATIMMPMFTKAITRTEFKEIEALTELTRTGARYYDLKYGIGALAVDTYQNIDQPRLWRALKVELPDDTKCKYEIRMVGSPEQRTLEISTEDSGVWTWLYRYNFEDESGVPNEDNPNKQYLNNLPGI